MLLHFTKWTYIGYPNDPDTLFPYRVATKQGQIQGGAARGRPPPPPLRLGIRRPLSARRVLFLLVSEVLSLLSLLRRSPPNLARHPPLSSGTQASYSSGIYSSIPENGAGKMTAIFMMPPPCFPGRFNFQVCLTLSACLAAVTSTTNPHPPTGHDPSTLPA